MSDFDGESWERRPAESAAFILERKKIKEAHGCAACQFRDTEIVKGIWSCELGQTPGRLGFCKIWRIDEDAKCLKSSNT